MGDQQKMAEAEVSLRLAIQLIQSGLTRADVRVAIDGAQVRTEDTVHFDLSQFLRDMDWIKLTAGGEWQGTYGNNYYAFRIVVHSTPGRGDVVAELIDGRTLRVECKKGTLTRSKSSSEYRLLREALGQLLTIETIGDRDLLAVAVPSSKKFEELARRWRSAPLIKRFGLAILTVAPNSISGLPPVMEQADLQSTSS